MSMLAQLHAQLARYDDDAFAALGNRGLLRRAYKDLETQAADIETQADAVIVTVVGQRVRFDARGPAQAQCDCPAAGVCQHLLAAAIVLKRSGETTTANAKIADQTNAGDASADQTSQDRTNRHRTDAAEANRTHADTTHADKIQADINDRVETTPAARAATAIDDIDAANESEWLAPMHAALLAFDAAALRQHAGKAGYRWAWQFVQDLDPERGLSIGGERHVRIAFAHPRVGFRYMGGSLDAMIADAQPSQIEKYRVAAVLAYQRAFGVAIAAPESSAKERTATLDLGKDHALADTSETAHSDARARLRARVKQLLLECIELGLSHLSPAIQQRFSTLAVWAQGADYYRLALMLRRLADHVEWLNERAGGADEHRLCDEIALTYGLIVALDAAAVRGAAPVHLVGRARNRYDAAPRLELLGLGAHAWRTPSGYLGLTMLFWSPAEQAFFSCTDARPEQQRGFDPIARYRAAGPWAGLGAPQQATGRRVVLDGAQLSAQGRLSGGDATHATVQTLMPESSFAAQLPACERWAELAQARAESKRSLLAEAQPMRDWVVLQPARYSDPRFDAARQTLVWPIYDAAGDRLDLELAYSAQTEHAIGRIEAAATAGLPSGTRVVARMRSDGEAVAEPLSLVYTDPRPGQSAVDALYFDPAPMGAGGLKQVIGSAWKHLRARGQDRQTPAVQVVASALPSPLRELRHALLTQAERGIGPTAAAAIGQSLHARLRRLRDAGLHAFPATLAVGTPLPEHLLRLYYLQLQYARLYDDGAEILES